jgi:hypothetical protein
VIFRLKDRGSGWYLATGPQGWKLVPPRDRRFAYLMIASDPNCREVREGIHLVDEWFGENKANGFELVPEQVMPG